ncbi:MAG TPA: hypothetical protein VGQ83_38285 [Polyangia bacterium]|jgi:hypothetical protein
MAYCRMVSSQPLPDGAFSLCFYQVDPHVLAQDVAVFFAQLQYKFEGGTPMRSSWGVGDDTARVLFGAFVKRYQFTISIDPQPGSPYVWLRLAKGISGAAGGLIGYSQMNTETQRVIGLIQHFFST